MNPIEQIAAQLRQLAEDFPEAQRALHEGLAARLERAVRGSVAATLHDTHGKIAGYQAGVAGSQGGYAAVRSIRGASGANSPAAITAATNNGHLRRMPSGRAKRYRPRVHVGYIRGRYYYERTEQAANTLLQREAQKLIDAFAEELRK